MTSAHLHLFASIFVVTLFDEPLLPLNELAKTLPHRPHVATLHRWRQRGCRGIRLRAVLVGGVWRSNLSWLGEFVTAVTRAANARSGQSAPPVSAPGTVEAEVLDKQLEERGL